MENQKIVACTKTLTIWAFIGDRNESEVLNKAKAQQDESIKTWTSHISKYPENKQFKLYLATEKKKSYKIMNYDDYVKAERLILLNKPLQEITEAKYWEMLECLPPLKWCTIGNIEMFCMSEMYTGTYTSQYAHDKKNDKYYSKLVDCYDKTTWINTII